MRTLRFDDATEKQYRDQIFKDDLLRMRYMLVLCVVLYMGYGLLDYVLLRSGVLEASDYSVFFYLRFYLLVPIFIIALMWSFHKSFRNVHQLLLSFAYILAGVGIAIMLVRAPENYSYYGGMFLIFSVGHLLTKIYIKYVSVSSVIIIILYNILYYIYYASIMNALIYSSFYIGFIIICIRYSIDAEKYRRENYRQTIDLIGSKIVLEKHLYDQLLEVEKANKITIYAMAQLAETRAFPIGDHVERVGKLSLAIAEKIDEEYYTVSGSQKEEVLRVIELAGILHDIGKVAIPEYILMKPEALSEEEMDIMKKHTHYGSQTLEQIRSYYDKNDFLSLGTIIAKYHHEWWNGKGYPEGLKGFSIPLPARILAVVDVYDALLNDRPYKTAVSKEEAIAIIESESGSQFDPVVVKAFLEVVESLECS